jgi:hypothetical protein
MEQTDLRLLGRLDGGPSLVPMSALKAVKTYRQAVRLCWRLRRAQNLKPIDLARYHNFIRQHVTDYVNPDDAPGRRDLPADRIYDFEDVCQNSAISQWIAARAKFTLLEVIQAQQEAA